MKKTNDKKWILIGNVAVDSGTLMISDPCYLQDKDWAKKDYDKEVCSKWDFHKQILGDNGFPKAVLFSSGVGDGIYNVYAKIKDCGVWGKRVAEVKIVLIDEEMEDALNKEKGK